VVLVFFLVVRRVRRKVAVFARRARADRRPGGWAAGGGALLATDGVVEIGSFGLRLLGHPVPLGTEEGGTGWCLLDVN